MIRHPQLLIFVATRPGEVPCGHFLSVDGSVPGAAITWDHHVTGEPINLDAMPEHFDASGFQGVGTTNLDTDAVASVVAVLAGGKGWLEPGVRRVLEAASHRCDHLAPLPGSTEEEDRLGRGLNAWVVHAARIGSSFDAICRQVATRRPLPWRDPDEGSAQVAVAALVEAGRLDATGPAAVVDLRGVGGVDPGALYQRHDRPVMVMLEDHPAGGLRVTVGINPRMDHPADLGPALRALARAEFAHGAPCVAPEPTPGAENWGGRRTVFGSPWNYGTRLAAAEIVSLVTSSLGL